MGLHPWFKGFYSGLVFTVFFLVPFCSNWLSHEWQWAYYSQLLKTVPLINRQNNVFLGVGMPLNTHLCDSDGKASVYNAGDPGSVPGLGRSPGEGNGSPLQYSCLVNPMDEEPDSSPRSCKESDTTERLHFHFGSPYVWYFLIIFVYLFFWIQSALLIDWRINERQNDEQKMFLV